MAERLRGMVVLTQNFQEQWQVIHQEVEVQVQMGMVLELTADLRLVLLETTTAQAVFHRQVASISFQAHQVLATLDLPIVVTVEEAVLAQPLVD
jgi:uncharacterized protein